MIYSIQMMLGLFRFLDQQSLILERINFDTLGQKVPTHNISLIKKYKCVDVNVTKKRSIRHIRLITLRILE